METSLISPERRKVWDAWDSQIRIFARHFLYHANLPRDKIFTLLDAGCGIGSALEEIHKAYPHALLTGCDSDIDHFLECKRVHSKCAKFILSDISEIQDEYDLIYVSNVLEHLSNWEGITKHLLSRCRRLYILVPYEETLPEKTMSSEMNSEHVINFNDESFNYLKSSNIQIVKRILRTPYAWGHPLRREIVLRIKACLKREHFDVQREILFAITNMRKKNDILPEDPFLNRLRTLVKFASL